MILHWSFHERYQDDEIRVGTILFHQTFYCTQFSGHIAFTRALYSHLFLQKSRKNA